MLPDQTLLAFRRSGEAPSSTGEEQSYQSVPDYLMKVHEIFCACSCSLTRSINTTIKYRTVKNYVQPLCILDVTDRDRFYQQGLCALMSPRLKELQEESGWGWFALWVKMSYCGFMGRSTRECLEEQIPSVCMGMPEAVVSCLCQLR